MARSRSHKVFEVQPSPSFDRASACPFCRRTGVDWTSHHLTPKSLGGKEQVMCCRECHKAVHALIPHKELRRYFHTVSRLLEHEGFQRMVAWIGKQDPGKRIAVDRPRDQRGRSKYR